jgi:hypothetical protein
MTSQLEHYVIPKTSQFDFVVRKLPDRRDHYSVAMPLRFLITKFGRVFVRLRFQELEQTKSWR